jgi:hypothetical protein
MIQAKFGLSWPIGFRGEYFWKSLQTDDGRQVMAIAHMTLWVRWANKRRIWWYKLFTHNSPYKKAIKFQIKGEKYVI